MCSLNACRETVFPTESSMLQSATNMFKAKADSIQVYGKVYKPNGTTPWPGKVGDSVKVFKSGALYGKSRIDSAGNYTVWGNDSVWISGMYSATTTILSDKFGTYQGNVAFYHAMDSVSYVNITIYSLGD